MSVIAGIFFSFRSFLLITVVPLFWELTLKKMVPSHDEADRCERRPLNILGFILITQFKCFWEIFSVFFFFFPKQKKWEITPCACRQSYVLPYWANNYWEKINGGQIFE